MKFQRSVAAIAMATALVTALGGCQQQSVTADKSPRPVKAIELAAPTNQQTLVLPALLAPIQQANIAFRVAGPVAKVSVIEGQRVGQGQALMHLDPHDFEVQVAEYQARLVEAKAQAAQARQERERVLAARQGDAIASVELDRANTAVKRAEASVDVVSQRLQMMQDALSYSRLTAPFSGRVASIDIEPHEQAMPAVTVMTLHGDQGFEVVFDLPELMAKRVTAGQSAQLTLNGSEARYPVTIHEISSEPNLLSRTFRVTARFVSQPQHGWPEQTGLLTLTIAGDGTQEFLLPSSAVVSDGSQQYVLVAEDQHATKVPVEVSGLQGQSLRVRGQLSAQQQVIVAGAAYLNDGDAIGKVLLDSAAAL